MERLIESQPMFSISEILEYELRGIRSNSNPEVKIRHRIHRILAHELSIRGFWSRTEDYEIYMQTQKEFASRIKNEVLTKTLGSDLVTHILNRSDRTFWIGLPYMTAFGFQLGRILHFIQGGNETNANEVSELCSLYNLGISFFDYLIDMKAGTIPKLLSVINCDTLSRLINDEIYATDLWKKIANNQDVDARVLTKIIASIFYRIHSLYLQSQHSKIMEEVNDCILSSFRLEMYSKFRHMSWSDRIEMHRKKSYLPFLTILKFTQLSPSINTKNEELTSLVESLGELFRTVDDLNDVFIDWATNSPNLIIASLEPSLNATRPHDKTALLSNLLKGDCIEKNAKIVCEMIEKVLHTSVSLCHSMNEHMLIRNFVIMYIRNWI